MRLGDFRQIGRTQTWSSNTRIDTPHIGIMCSEPGPVEVVMATGEVRRFVNVPAMTLITGHFEEVKFPHVFGLVLK